MASSPIHSECPCCRAKLEIDPTNGEVLAHQPPPQDLEQALRRNSEGGQGGRDAFAAAMDAEKHRAKELDDLFKKAADKQRKADPDRAADNPLDDRWR